MPLVRWMGSTSATCGRSSTLPVLRTLCRNPHGMFWAGDTAQTISVGSAFRFNDLKAFLYRYEEVRGKRHACSFVAESVPTLGHCTRQLRQARPTGVLPPRRQLPFTRWDCRLCILRDRADYAVMASCDRRSRAGNGYGRGIEARLLQRMGSEHCTIRAIPVRGIVSIYQTRVSRQGGRILTTVFFRGSHIEFGAQQCQFDI